MSVQIHIGESDDTCSMVDTDKLNQRPKMGRLLFPQLSAGPHFSEPILILGSPT